MRTIVLFIFFFLFIFSTKISFCQASEWVYPLDRSPERVLVKDFGILVDKNFYIGKENLFPNNRFYGYHAGVDLETFTEEQKTLTPFYAIYPGVITYADSVNGYGGVILERLDDNRHVALYGHIQLNNLKVKLGNRVESKQLIGYLGEAYTPDSGNERKHLHFALHKGTDNFFLGHEQTLAGLNKNWENPMEFLKNHGAVSPVLKATTIPEPTEVIENNSTQQPTDLMQNILNFLRSWFLELKNRLLG